MGYGAGGLQREWRRLELLIHERDRLAFSEIPHQPVQIAYKPNHI
jgi:hypothetical protein